MSADDLHETLAKALNGHHVTRGMQVASGVTCECRYWTGSEPDAGKRPLPWGRDRLDLHRAAALIPLIQAEIDKARAEVVAAVEAVLAEADKADGYEFDGEHNYGAKVPTPLVWPTLADPQAALAADRARVERQHRHEWADYIEHWDWAVGAPPCDPEAIIHALRADAVPFGCAAAVVADSQPDKAGE